MNTIKFSNIRQKTTEQHNLETAEIRNIELFGKQYKMYTPCNLNIFITNECQNHCDFCINKDYAGTDISDEEYHDALDRLLQNLKDLPIEITITGGEPTLNKERFVLTLAMCNNYNFKCRTVSTTGIQLMADTYGRPLCESMIVYHFIHNISISRMSIDDMKNDTILKGKNLSNDDIERLALFYRLRGAEMRLSCNLINGYMDSFDKMLNFVDFYRKLGISTIMFRELAGCKNQPLLKDVVHFNRKFQYLETLKGMYYNVDVYQYKDMLVKHYTNNTNIDKNILSSMSFRNGILQRDFKTVIKDLR